MWPVCTMHRWSGHLNEFGGQDLFWPFLSDCCTKNASNDDVIVLQSLIWRFFFYFNNLPCGRYAPMVRTSKWIWRARSGTAVKIVLIRIISTIVVSIAKPVRFHTNSRIFTLHMTLRAGHILISTSYFRLIRSTVVLAIIDTITFLTFRDTSVIFASEFTGSAIFVFAI